LFKQTKKESPNEEIESDQKAAPVITNQGWKGTENDREQLKRLIEKEKTHKQWDKHSMCTICLSSMVIVTLMRGSKSVDSIVGIERCSVADWSILILYLIICGTVLMIALREVLKE
jgi:hypothetical protein